MRGTVFYKMTGSGNDFVMLDGRHARAAEWTAERVRAICDRRMGVGADGLAILTPARAGQVVLRYWNSDGSEAAMCGNAALCATRLAVYLELAGPEGMVLLTKAGPVRTRCASETHLAELCLPPFDLPRPVDLEPGPGERGFYAVTVGVPHLVVITEDAGAVDVERRGRELRHHPTFGAEGTNVNFVSPPTDGDGATWLIRTYERGVEAETLACGTGTVAAAYALDIAGLRPLPSDWQTRRRVRLGVAGGKAGTRAEEPWLVGEGRLVFTGILGD